MAEPSDDILSRLKGISSDEKSEMGKMKCRIDDQARLIMMLKKRNDEYILANMALDKHSIDLEKQIEELNEQLEEQQSMKNQVEQLILTIEQFKTSNYQWELKEQQNNQRFLFHNQQHQILEQDILDFKKEINHLQQLLKETNENCEKIQNDSKKKLIERDKIIENQRIDIEQLKIQLTNLQEKIEEKDQNIQQIQKYHLNNLDQLEKSKKSLEEQIEKLQKRLQNNSTNEDKLRQELDKLQKLLNQSNERFITEEERVNSNVRVQQLQTKLIESQQKIETLEQEFLGYKNYTASLLNKEKHLNERLQLLLNGRTT